MKKAAIIGSGPAGLTCAEQLNQAGFSVTVFDELKEFGGMLAYGIPEFRIPLSNAKERVQALENKGVLFKKKKILSIKKLLLKFGGEFDVVVIAIGAGAGSKAGFDGEGEKGVIDALDFLSKSKLAHKKLISKGETVAVIGGGNSAMDAARVAKRMGGEVTILYRRTENEMPALKSEIEGTKKDGIVFEFLKSPSKFVCEKNKKSKLICNELVLGEEDASGRKRPVETGKMSEREFDKIISAIGQQQDFLWLEEEGVKTNGKIILIDSNYSTSLEGVYACGDCVTGAKTIGEATLGGLKTAKSIISNCK